MIRVLRIQLFRSSESIAFGHAERESRTDLPIAFRGYLCGELPVVGFVQNTGDFDVERIVECCGIHAERISGLPC